MARTTTNESLTADAEELDWSPNFIVNGMPAYTVPPSESFHLDPDVPNDEYCDNSYCDFCSNEGPTYYRSLDYDPRDYLDDGSDIFDGMLPDGLHYMSEMTHHSEYRFVRAMPSDLDPIEVDENELMTWDEYALTNSSKRLAKPTRRGMNSLSSMLRIAMRS